MSSAPTLVFGDDGSPSSDVAWLWINTQTWPGWSLEVVTAHMPPFGPPPPESDAVPHVWQPPNPRVPFAEAAFRDAVNLAAEADPRVLLLRAADLLVIGTRGRGLLKALHLGSTAEWLLQRPPCPMVIARAGHRVRSVVIGHDGSTHARRAIRALVALPLVGGTRCAVVVADDGRVDVAAAVADAQRALAEAGIEPEIVHAQGPATAAIAGEVDRRGPDLLVLGTRGLTGLRLLHLGSTAAALARTATCSVLVACADVATQPA